MMKQGTTSGLVKLCLSTSLIFGSLAACEEQDMAEREQSRLEKYELTAKETEVARALLAGYRIEMGISRLPYREYDTAACYARAVNMPDQYHRAHLIYLENYPKADDDWNNFWAETGIGITTANAMSDLVEKAYAVCD